ncbi:Putative manganese efflux pump MntP, partial [Dysosmobacter welbionis]
CMHKRPATCRGHSVPRSGIGCGEVMRDADSMADTGLPVPRRPAGVVSGGRRDRAGQCGGSFGPLCPFRGPLPVPLPGGLLSAAGSGVRGAGRPLAGGADGAAVPGPRCWQCCAGAGVGGGLPHRRQDGSRPLPGKSGLPGGGGAAAGLLQQLQSGVPHQCAGRGGVRQCAGRGVAVADPCALRPSDGTGVS